MDTCKHCGREVQGSASSCPHCSSEAIIDVESMPHNTKQDAGKTEVIEAEIVSSRHRQHEYTYNNQQQQNTQRGYTFTSYGFGNAGRGFGSLSQQASCLPGMITLIIGISLGVQHGFLASIGFFVFYGIGSAFGFALTLRRAALGLYISPWITRCIVWFISAFITIALAT